MEIFFFFVVAIVIYTASKRVRGKFRYSWQSEELVIVNTMDYWSFYNQRNLKVVYVYLAGWMMKKNNRDSREKMRFIRTYFSAYFKEGDNVASEMSDALRYDINLMQISGWLNRVMKTDQPKQDLLNFLIALCYEDGDVTQNEYDGLVYLAELIKVSKAWVDQRVQEEKSRRERQKRAEEAPREAIRSESKRQLALRTLGVTETCSEEVVKKAYRKLAKMHHPDKYQQAGELQRSEASRRFVEIQLAYEYLCEYE